MSKVYAPSNSPADRAFREAFQNYGIDPPVSEDKRGRFYEIEIPKWWLRRRRASFDLALRQAGNSAGKQK